MDASVLSLLLFVVLAYLLGRYLLGRITRSAAEAYALAVLVALAGLGLLGLASRRGSVPIIEMAAFVGGAFVILALPAALGVYVARRPH